MSDTSARAPWNYPKSNRLPAGSNSGFPTGSIVGGERRVSKWGCNDRAGRPIKAWQRESRPKDGVIAATTTETG